MLHMETTSTTMGRIGEILTTNLDEGINLSNPLLCFFLWRPALPPPLAVGYVVGCGIWFWWTLC
jgi:hypothetical protein